MIADAELNAEIRKMTRLCNELAGRPDASREFREQQERLQAENQAILSACRAQLEEARLKASFLTNKYKCWANAYDYPT